MVAISVAKHFESLRGAGSGYLLTALDRYGLIKEAPPGTETEMRPSGLIFPLTDESVLRAILFYGGYLSVASILLAVWAEYRREENLYLSAGFMCGAGGILLAHTLFGIVAVAAGVTAVLLLRHARSA
ncbi:MAG: hypothetical protein HY020_15310 [Burkholderiales bacterium]|nr:hypothetical protein [Burkholderiales bacterium]